MKPSKIKVPTTVHMALWYNYTGYAIYKLGPAAQPTVVVVYIDPDRDRPNLHTTN